MSYFYSLSHQYNINLIFEARGATTQITNTNFQVNGTDLSALFMGRTYGYRRYINLSQTLTYENCILTVTVSSTPISSLFQIKDSLFFTVTGTATNVTSTVPSTFSYGYKFTGNGTITFTNNTRAYVTLIGGGGGGGGSNGGAEGGGGGGAGGIWRGSVYCLANQAYYIYIGAGGSGNPPNNFGGYTLMNKGAFIVGTLSTQKYLIAQGGGGGGGSGNVAGSNGGCGGGGTGYQTNRAGGTAQAGSEFGVTSEAANYINYDNANNAVYTSGNWAVRETTTNGNDGARGIPNRGGGGGGGLGGVGVEPGNANGGAGGAGITIYGVAVGGGGGGGSSSGGQIGGAGGSGGGGKGEDNGEGPVAGTANTGGGGGAQDNLGWPPGANGGSGIAWIVF